jgi:hypothetical protein
LPPAPAPGTVSSWWDKNLILSVLSLLVALAALWLYVGEVTKASDLELTAFSPNREWNKVDFIFSGADPLSTPLELDLGLVNRGRASSQGPAFSITFSPLAQATLRPGGANWGSQEIGPRYTAYSFQDRTLVLNPSTNRTLGIFDLRVPKPTSDVLLAFFFVEGDFPRKEGLLYYSPSKREYVVRHFTEPNAGTRVWNEQIAIWNKTVS